MRCGVCNAEDFTDGVCFACGFVAKAIKPAPRAEAATSNLYLLLRRHGAKPGHAAMVIKQGGGPAVDALEVGARLCAVAPERYTPSEVEWCVVEARGPGSARWPDPEPWSQGQQLQEG